jgi:hypothetical protein
MKVRDNFFNPYEADELAKHLEKSLALVLHYDEVQKICEIVKEVYNESNEK